MAPTNRDWPAGIEAACDRLVHPSATGEARRVRMRLIGVLLAAPFLVAGAGAVMLATILPVTLLVAGICVLFGVCWTLALLVALDAPAGAVAGVALGAAAGAVAVLAAAGGGLASPLALLAGALALEAWWIGRDGRSVRAGIAAGLAGLAGSALIDFGGAAGTAPWHWAIPAAWLVAFWPRIRMAPSEGLVEDAGRTVPDIEDEDEAELLFGSGGEVVAASPATRDLLGLDPQLLLGSGFFDRVHVGDRVPLLCAIGDGKPARVEVRVRLPAAGDTGGNENHRDLELKLRRSRNGGSMRAVLADNSELAALRAAVAAAREAADGSEIAKSRFLAAVSHELRTPLNSIIGFSDMLLHEMFGPFADPRQKEYVSLVKQSGSHLLSVVNAILDVSRIESGTYSIEPEPFEFRGAVEMCLAMLLTQAKAKDVTLMDDVPESVAEIAADRRAVQQMLINLMANAIKFTPAGGTVRVGARRVGSRLHFWVEDDGIGMSAEDLSRVGRPFTQVHNEYTRQFDGAGLGLSLVKGLVALHQGGMQIESAPGEGTKVTISLPVDGPAPAAGTKGEPKTKGDECVAFRKAG